MLLSLLLHLDDSFLNLDAVILLFFSSKLVCNIGIGLAILIQTMNRDFILLRQIEKKNFKTYQGGTR